ncbi:hypothetical protein [Oscillatoria acuminata]|uniref:hypothetical protein n=1 Tax=Oscillatoria acuminata TaxID=118323 RepID=UPI0002F40F66|nr:hypothetical protein [Oscillatoria acuminata]
MALEARTVEETTEEAEQAIQGLVNFFNTIQSGIYTKAIEDLKSGFELFNSALKATKIN